MKNRKFYIGDVVGCWGEGNSIYKITVIDGENCYLEAFGNTSVDGGWHYSDNLRVIDSYIKTDSYDVWFFGE